MQSVGAAFADDVNLARREAVLSRIVAALDFEFLDRVLRQNNGRSHKGRIGVDQSVERVAVAFGSSAVHADRIAFALTHRALLAAYCHCAGADQEQLHEIAPVQRKLFHLLLAY